MIRAAGATSATVGYKGYRHATCISINHVVCHGIPSEKRLRDGDILNIDVTVIVDGWYGDSSRMYVAGRPARKAERLIDITHDALMEGIAQVAPGNTFGDIGAAIQRFAEAHRCSVVRDFCGHGLGRVFHAAPNVLHYGRWGSGPVLEPGMFFTIEPMINLGRPETKVLDDDWTAVTKDRSLSAQFEHSVGVTETGVEIFTLSPAGRFHPTWAQAAYVSGRPPACGGAGRRRPCRRGSRRAPARWLRRARRSPRRRARARPPSGSPPAAPACARRG